MQVYFEVCGLKLMELPVADEQSKVQMLVVQFPLQPPLHMIVCEWQC